MSVEQLPPNKPNFLLILVLFGVTIVVVFVLAWLFLRGDANHLGFRHHDRHPTSHLVQPLTLQSPSQPLASQA